MHRTKVEICAAIAVCVLGTAAGHAQNKKLAAALPVTYDNKYEAYGGISFLNTQAGQNLTERTNLGGIEVMGTDWFTGHLGVAAEFRGEAGTTNVLPSPFYVSGVRRPLVYELMGLGGVQYRGPKNRYAAIDYHALAGVAHGVFDTQTAGSGLDVGLYTNRTRPIFAVGGSLDLNRSKRFAIRLSPDLIIEHWGTETREFFSISGGVIYRIGSR